MSIVNGRACFAIWNCFYYDYFSEWYIIVFVFFPDVTITVNDWEFMFTFILVVLW